MLAYLNEGEFFGEMGLFDESTSRSAWIIARTDCDVAVADYATFRQMSEHTPAILFSLAGQIAGPPGSLPEVHDSFTMTVDLLDRVVGDEESEIEEISTGEPLMMTVGTATTVGSVTSARGGECDVQLKRPVCAPAGAKIAINRRIGARWRLIGVGTLR